jgi:hypothetical protein
VERIVSSDLTCVKNIAALGIVHLAIDGDRHVNCIGCKLNFFGESVTCYIDVDVVLQDA